MKTLSIISFILMSLVALPSWGETMDDLVQRDGIYYKKFSDVPFTGEVEGKSQGRVKNGKRDGPWVNYRDDEQLWSKGDFKNGKKEGFWIYYWENGQLHKKGEYKNGKKEGRWITYSPFGSPRPGFDGIYRDGVWISE